MNTGIPIRRDPTRVDRQVLVVPLPRGSGIIDAAGERDLIARLVGEDTRLDVVVGVVGPGADRLAVSVQWEDNPDVEGASRDHPGECLEALRHQEIGWV